MNLIHLFNIQKVKEDIIHFSSLSWSSSLKKTL